MLNRVKPTKRVLFDTWSYHLRYMVDTSSQKVPVYRRWYEAVSKQYRSRVEASSKRPRTAYKQELKMPEQQYALTGIFLAIAL